VPRSAYLLGVAAPHCSIQCLDNAQNFYAVLLASVSVSSLIDTAGKAVAFSYVRPVKLVYDAGLPVISLNQVQVRMSLRFLRPHERPNTASRIGHTSPALAPQWKRTLYTRGCPSPKPRYSIPFEPGELSCRHLMMLLRFSRQPREMRSLPNRLKPRIAQHGGITKEPPSNHAFKKFERGIDLVQACEMPRQIKESFGGR
jgi:hypothetical protein